MVTANEGLDRKIKISNKSQTLIGFFATLFIILTFAYFAFGTYRNWSYKVESDGKYYYHFLVSLVYDHDINFTNNYLTPKPDWMRLPIDPYGQRAHINPVNGAPSNLWTVGPAILWFPFFLVTWVCGSLINLLFHAGIDLDPWGLFIQYGTMYAAVVYTLLTLWLVYLLLKDYFSLKAILPALALLLFASNLFYYSVMEVSMSHVYDFFSLVLFVYCFKRATDNLGNTFQFAILGAAAGLHTLVRTQNVVIIGIFGLFLAYLLLRDRATAWNLRLLNFVLFGAVYFFSCLPIFLINNYLFNNPLTVPQGAGFLSSPHILEILFSTHNGLFLLNPVLFVGFLSFLWLLWRTWRTKNPQGWWLVTLLAAFFAQVIINSSAEDWWGGDSFGQRRLIGSFLIFAIGLTNAFEKIATLKSAPRLLSKTVLWALVPLNLFLMYQFVFVWDY